MEINYYVDLRRSAAYQNTSSSDHPFVAGILQQLNFVTNAINIRNKWQFYKPDDFFWKQCVLMSLLAARIHSLLGGVMFKRILEAHSVAIREIAAFTR